jgi:diguanylate cyclase (GGDEF)-like protein
MPRSAHVTAATGSIAAVTAAIVRDEALDNIAQHACEVLKVWECDLYGWVAPEAQVTCLALWAREADPGDAGWVGAKLSLDEQPSFRRVVTEGRTVAAHVGDHNVSHADKLRMEAWGQHSSLLVPMIFQDKVMGCLQLVEKRHTRIFSARDRKMATTLASLAALAMHSARLCAEVELLATTDGVTGLHNHRDFCERLAAEVVRADRYGLNLAVLMIDIDGFKSYNDRRGHPAGDTLLRSFGGLLLGHTRAHIDVVGRYGGDEFAIALPNTTAGVASTARERLRGAITRGRFFDMRLTAKDTAGAPTANRVEEVSAGTVAERIRTSVETDSFGTDLLPPVITVSIGVAGLGEHVGSVEALIEAADRALYRAKQLGKNRVEFGETRLA